MHENRHRIMHHCCVCLNDMQNNKKISEIIANKLM